MYLIVITGPIRLESQSRLSIAAVIGGMLLILEQLLLLLLLLKDVLFENETFFGSPQTDLSSVKLSCNNCDTLQLCVMEL